MRIYGVLNVNPSFSSTPASIRQCSYLKVCAVSYLIGLFAVNFLKKNSVALHPIKCFTEQALLTKKEVLRSCPGSSQC